MNLGQFLGLPMTAGPRDIPRGEDELGNILYEAQGGARYTKKTAPANNRSIVKALAGQAKADPWGTIGDLVKGAAQGAWDAVAAPGRSWSDSTMTYGDVANTAGLVSLPAAFGKYDPAVANMGIRAYHGSPHDFDRFDMSKIGTGEGAQAYGHGLYFAEAEDVARQYRDNLSGGRMMNAGVSFDGGDVFDAPDGTRAILQELDPILRKTGSVDAALKELDDRAANARLGYTQIRSKDMADFLRQNRDRIEYTPPGRMYEVDINADPADFLDWDAPLSEQPAKVKSFAEQRYNQFFGRPPGPDVDGEMIKRIASPQNDLDGREWLDIGPAADASKRLKEAGIPGIKYYDQGSRAGKEGTRNYVVFDDSLIEILRKYGLAGAAPLGAILGTQDDEKQRIRDFLSQ